MFLMVSYTACCGISCCVRYPTSVVRLVNLVSCKGSQVPRSLDQLEVRLFSTFIEIWIDLKWKWSPYYKSDSISRRYHEKLNRVKIMIFAFPPPDSLLPLERKSLSLIGEWILLWLELFGCPVSVANFLSSFGGRNARRQLTRLGLQCQTPALSKV